MESFSPLPSGEDGIDPMGLATGGGDLLLAMMFEDQGLSIQSEKMHEGCGEIVGGHHVFYCTMTKLVGGSVHHPRPDPASCQPDAEALSIVIPPILLGRSMILCHRQATDFATPVDDGLLQQASLVQVFHQSGGWTIGFSADRRQGGAQGAVVVPGLTCMEQLHKPDASFH